MLMALTTDPPENKSLLSTSTRKSDSSSDWDEYKPTRQWKNRTPETGNKRKRSASAATKNKRYETDSSIIQKNIQLSQCHTKNL